MSLKVADVGVDCILKCFFNNTRPSGGNNLTLKLFVNNIVPADTDTAATYTVAVGGGYADKTLTNGSWTINTANDPSDAVYNTTQVFTFTGPLTTNTTIYGYYIVDADGILQWAEKMYLPDGTTPVTFTPATNGDHLDITVKFQASSGTPA